MRVYIRRNGGCLGYFWSARVRLDSCTDTYERVIVAGFLRERAADLTVIYFDRGKEVVLAFRRT